MDTTKYKSVATKLETYHKAKVMAGVSHRSIGQLISMIVDEAWNKQPPSTKRKLNGEKKK